MEVQQNRAPEQHRRGSAAVRPAASPQCARPRPRRKHKQNPYFSVMFVENIVFSNWKHEVSYKHMSFIIRKICISESDIVFVDLKPVWVLVLYSFKSISCSVLVVLSSSSSIFLLTAIKLNLYVEYLSKSSNKNS